MKFTDYLRLFGVCAIILSLTGCYLRPDFRAPGTKDFQRSRAVIYDPFPDSNAGPSIEGGRPLGYQRPLSDTSRVQMTTNRQAPY